MRFDDRLKTAITQPVVDDHDRIVRWRQLVDLLSRLPADHDRALSDAAFAVVERELPAIPEAARAAAARSAASRAVDARLVALFSRDRLSVAAPVLASANLTNAEWDDIQRDSSPEVSRFIRSMDRSAAQYEPSSVPTADYVLPVPAGREQDETPSISQMVARIEQLRHRREPTQDDVAVAVPPQPEEPVRPVTAPTSAHPVDQGMFRWECDASGQIGWVEGAPRGALVGQAISEQGAGSKPLAQALRSRQPFDGARITFDVPAIEGDWRLSGIPAFSPRDGRFLGYRGVARRADVEPEAMTAKSAARTAKAKGRDLDALRETVHEIKTPLNAIIGFAEIIDGQYLGPAHRNYRQRAAEIVAQARTLLAAIEDLDLAARLQGRDGPDRQPCRLAEVFPALGRDLEQLAAMRDVTVSIVPPPREQRCQLSEEVASRLLKRFLGSVIESAGKDERLVINGLPDNGSCLVSITRPKSTEAVQDKLLTDPEYSAPDAGPSILGLGFALRLVRGLARLVGGELLIERDRFALKLPTAG